LSCFTIEVRFFANRDQYVHFALLTDFADAAEQTLPGDAALIEIGLQHTNDLNERHGAGRFFFFHRERQWNPLERRWMGRERKRGKLAEFNKLLRGATDTSYMVQHGDLSILPSVRYVITLDSDTQLPMEVARRLVGTLSHPLNRPRFDPRLQRVTEGYGVLQPRVSVNVVSANRTAFARVFSGHVGVDPYTTAVSDVYQDLFHEGSYVGKGIYDVDAFEGALAGQYPENQLLSHDLFEGFYARGVIPTSTWWTTTLRTTSRSRHASIGGSVETGRLPAGCGAPCRMLRDDRCRTRCRSSRGGRSSTTCAAA
jgi:cyclic beta-1,2-glucan synthetase